MSIEALLDNVMKERHGGLVIKPMLRTFLFNADYPDNFSIHFKKGDQNREPDGWFWPSTHPQWPLRALWLYLNDPQSLPHEDRQLPNTLALTFGTAIHGFLEMCMEQMGLRPKALNYCRSCPPEKKCKEPGFADREIGSRGHLDGLLDLTSLKPLPPGVPDDPAWELKTASDRVISSLTDLDVEDYRRRHPVYYSQNQEYMELSGTLMMIVNFVQLGWPWDMKEIHVPYDEAWSETTRGKYSEVRQTDEMPECCNRKSCMMADWCSMQDKSQRAFLMPRPTRRD